MRLESIVKSTFCLALLYHVITYKIGFLSEILDEGSSDEEGGSASGSDSEDSEENEGRV